MDSAFVAVWGTTLASDALEWNAEAALAFDDSPWCGERLAGRTGSLPGYESVAYYSPAHRTTIEVVSTKIAEAWTPPPMFQALAMAILGPHLGFGLTPAQALTPNFSAGDEPDA